MFPAYDAAYGSIHVFGTRYMRDRFCGQCRSRTPILNLRALMMVFMRKVRFVHHYGIHRPLVVRVALDRGVKVRHTYPVRYRTKLLKLPRHMAGTIL